MSIIRQWHPEQAEINNPRVNFFKWGFVGIAGIIFGSVGLIITPSTKNLAGNGSPAHEKIHYTAQFTDTPASDSNQ